MRILFISTVFPSPLQPNKGAFNSGMIRGLSTADEVRVIAPIPWPVALTATYRNASWPAFREIDGVSVRHPVYLYPPKILRRFYGTFFRRSISGAVHEVLREFEPQLVLGYWAHPDGEAAVRIAARLGVPGVVMVGGTDVLVLGTGTERKPAIHRVLEEADAVITVSQDLRRTLVGWGLGAGKVHVAQRGVDTTRFSPGPRDEARRKLGISTDRPCALWVGHMVPVKGLDVLIAACASAGAHAGHQLFLVGDGPLRPALEKQVEEAGLSGRVHFVGYVPHDDLPNWFRAADVTVLPSRSEGIPNVLLESAACGTPFVASRVGGVPEIADPILDRLVAPGDAGLLRDALVNALVAPSRLVRVKMPLSSHGATERLRNILAAATTDHHARTRAATMGPIHTNTARAQS